MLFATTGYVLLPSSLVWANPAGEQVVGGAATFQRDGNTLTVNQTTDRLAVNWQSFNIAAGEHTHFNMPSAASIALNRVLGGNPSDIRGTLTGNGTIIVANQFGISTAPGSVIKTGSLILTTKDINPEQFMHADPGQGIHLYGDSTATIVNQGNLTAEKGDVFLIAQKVENRGTISAPNGKAALVGAGGGQDKTDVVLYEKEGSGFAVRVTQLMGEAAAGSNRGLPDGEELLNEGEIAAAQAELNASGNIYALAIRNSGTIRAKAVLANADGTVRLDGGLGDVRNTGTLIAKNAGAEATAAGGKIEVTGQNVTATPESIITAAGGEQGGSGGKVKIDSADTTIVQGKVDVSAPAGGAKGGKAEILGERVGLFEGAKVNASGGAGGGTVLVGGDYLGGQTPAEDLLGLVRLEDGPVKNAKATVMADTAEIRADATANGDGGKIILWSDEYTGFYGELFAQGGAEGGNGGFVETSSKNNLQAFGNVFLQAASGSGGHWLLDPLNVSIVATGGDSIPVGGGTFNPTTADAQVNAGSIVTAIQGGNNVTITTFGSQIITNPDGSTSTINQDGDINVGAAIAIGAGQPAYGNLTLTATRNIAVNAAINFGNATASVVTLETGSAGGISGGGQITLNSTGGLRLVSGSGGTSVQINNPLVAGVAGGIAAVSTGNISITGTSTSVIPVVSIGGTIGISTTGNIDLSGQTAILGGSTLIGANVNIFADADFQFESDRFAGAVQTTQRQRYQGAVTFTENTVLSSGQDIVFRSTVDGPGEVILIVGRQTDLIDLVGSLVPLGAFRQEGGLINFYAEGTSLIPSIQVEGSATFDSANLVLWENTFLRSASDVIFGGDINSSFFDVPAVFDVATTAGNIIFDGQVGSTAALGNLTVEAGGTGQIALNQGATTLPGNSPVNTGADGAISLKTENNSVVLAGTIDTRGGLSVGSVLGGDFEVTAGGTGSNIQLEGAILTRGGTMDFNNSVFISAAAFLDNTEADTRGTITFADSVFFGGNLSLVSGGAVAFNGDVNGANDVSILVQNNNNLTFAGNLGNTIPLGSLTVQTGGGDVILSSDISTGGGAVSFGMRVRLGDNVSIDTTKLNNANGGRVEFLQGVVGAESGRVYVNNVPQFIPYAAGQPYLITRLVGTEPGDVPTNFALIGAVPVAATGLQIGQEYIITASGNTNFTDFGATSNAVGTVFTATKSGSALDGTGTTLLTYFTATGAGAGSGTANELNDLVVNGGITGVVGFGASAQAPQYSGRINSLTVLNAGSFSVTSALEAFGENANGNALDFLPSLNSTLAGSVNILKSVGTGNILLRNGINTSFLSAKAGSVTLQSVGTGEVIIRGSVAMNGGSNLSGTIGFDGGDLIVNSKANFIMPTSISNTGGDGTFTDGKAGKVTIDTTSGTGTISFSSGIFDVIQDSQYTLAAGGSVILGILADPNANLFSSDPADLRISGTVLQLNRTAQGTDFSLASRGSFNVGYGGSLEANQADAYFYVPSESAILTFGGTLGIVRLHNSPAASYSPTRNEGGLPQLGGVNLNGQTVTTVEGLASGNVSINQNGLKQAITGNSLAVVESGVVLTGAITTRGGTPPQETIVGLKGGDVRITGTSVFLNGIINTSGSNSLDGGENDIGIGGVGGTVDITGTTGITIGRDIITSGGSGISQLSGTGGPGGAINLGGSVLLDSRSGDITTIVLDTQGGLGLRIGDEGAGGNIRAIGSITGTEANTNTLDLRYGSGQVTLGSDASDVISLGELITAADDARSTGLLQVRAFMDEITTLTTYARGYNISLSGGGTVVNQATFLNTGFVQIGNRTPGLAFDTTTTFAGGINTQTGPSATVLAGQLQTSNEFLDTEASILLGAVELGRNSFLNTFGNTLALGSLDSITDSFDLTLLAGIGNGAIQLPGNIGAKAGQLSVLGNGTFLAAPGIITIQDMPLRIDPIVFAGTVNAEAISSISSIPFEFRQDVNLSGISNIAGNVTLNNVAGGSNVLAFNMGADSEIGGNLTLQGGAASLGGDGDWAIAGAVNGGQNLTIQGSGIKTFGGLIGTQATPLGGPTGPSIRVLAERVEFTQAVQTLFGISSEVGTTTAFLAGANVTTRGSSQFLGTVELSGMSFNAGGATRFTDLNLSGGTVTLAGTGTYNTTGPVSGNGFNLILGGTTSSSKVFAGGLTDLGLLSLLSASGASTFGGFVQADNILQAAGAGRANFAGNVEIRTGTLSSFGAGVLLGDGITFTTSAGTTTFLATSTPRLGGNVTLAGAGDIAFDAALRGDNAIIGNTAVLTLADSGQRIFGNTVSAGSLVQEAGAGLLSANQTITLADGLGTSRLRNAALTGMTLAAAGTVEILGTVTANGNTTISGGTLPEAIVLGAGNNLVANTTGATFTLKGGVRMEADAVLDGVGNYAFANNINGASYLLTLGAGGTKAFQGQLSLDRIVQDDGSNTATFAGGVELVGDGILLGNVVLSGANQTFRSLGGSLQFGNAGSDLLTISKASVLVSDAATSVTVASQIRLTAQLGIQTGSVFLGQIAGSSSNLSLDVNDVNLGGTVALGSGTMTMRSLDPLAISLGDNPLGLNLDKTELGLISTSGGLRIEDSSGSGISVDNVASTDVAGITGPVRLLSTGGVVAFMSPSTLPKLGVAAQDVSGLNNATFQEIVQLELVNPAADININAGGSMAISGPVAIGGGKNFNLTANGDVVIGSQVSSGGGVLINPQGGYFVNQSGGQVFDNATLNSVNGVRVVTRDLFTPGLATAFVPGLQVVFGVSDPALLGRNQIGSTANFTDGNFAPYYFEFATGSAQPYIFAQQTAVPLVQFAPALNFAGGLPTPPRYTADELEMLTPEERSAYEARQREQSARVILQSSAGQEELGANPSAPQASRVPDSRAPKTPTAQVWLQGKPMARSGSDSDRHDTTRLLRPKGTRAVALRDAEMNTELLLAERISAEIGISAKPIASQR